MIEEIRDGDAVMAIILRREYLAEGIEFLTPESFTQQLGYMNRPRGYVIKPHLHRPVTREVAYTSEVLYIKSGKVRVDFYGQDQSYRESRLLNDGDVVLLMIGGHGFEMIEKSEIIEVKQGPYAGERDKIRFEPVASDRIKLSG
jgi:mannose-6-phosphate isomerase-like protein (cupin superfamily)